MIHSDALRLGSSLSCSLRTSGFNTLVRSRTLHLTMPSTRLADTKAAELHSQNWKGTATDGSDTKLFMGGLFVSSKTRKWIDVNDPVRHPDALLLYDVFNNKHETVYADYFDQSPRAHYR